MNRDVQIELNIKGVMLKGLGEAVLLTHTEALGLLESLLRVMPEVTTGVEASWELRETPTIRIRTFHHFDGDDGIYQTYRGEVWKSNYRYPVATKRLNSQEAAIEKIKTLYGRDLALRDTYDCPGSRRSAEKKLKSARLVKIFQDSGMSLEEFVARAKGKTINTETGAIE